MKKETSESSIEKIDQDFSIVDISEDEYKRIPSENASEIQINKPVITSEVQSEVDIELPECPNADDFQITDFIQANTIITVEHDDEKKTVVYDNENSMIELFTNSSISSEIHQPNDEKDVLEVKTLVEEPVVDAVVNLEKEDTVEDNDDESNIIILGNDENEDHGDPPDNNSSSDNVEVLNPVELIETVVNGEDQNIAHVDIQAVNGTKFEVTDTNEILKVDDEVESVEPVLIVNDLSTDDAKIENLLGLIERHNPDIISSTIEDKPAAEKDQIPHETNSHQNSDGFPKPALDEMRTATVNANMPFVGGQHHQPYRAGITPGNFTHNPIGCSPLYPNLHFPVQNMFYENNPAQKYIPYNAIN